MLKHTSGNSCHTIMKVIYFVFLLSSLVTSLTNGECLNDEDFRADYRPKTSCLWVRYEESRRQLYCADVVVSEACPQACGVCCEDDESYEFTDGSGKLKNCNWIGKATDRPTKWCNRERENKLVKEACHLTCDVCQSIVQTIDKPSPEPSGDEHTKAPIDKPSPEPSGDVHTKAPKTFSKKGSKSGKFKTKKGKKDSKSKKGE